MLVKIYRKHGILPALLIVLKLFLIVPVGAAGMIFLYGAAGIFLTAFAVNRDYTEAETGTAAYIISNDAHTSVCLPVRTKYTDWLSFTGLSPERFGGARDLYGCFGWGDRDFFVRTPTWGDLTLDTALKSLFWPTEGAMLLSFYRGPFKEDRLQKRIVLSDRELLEIETYIKESFLLDAAGKPMELPVEYEILRKWGRNEFFFYAHYTYHLFFTCNNWTNRGLKETGIRTALWAPFERSVLWHLP